MRVLRMMVVVGAVAGGCLALTGAEASAAPSQAASLATTAASGPAEDYMYSRRYRPRHYTYRRVYRPRRAYYRPRYYSPRYYRPRVVCRVRYTAWGPRRVCYRR
jgi:hypothetical protein